MESLVTVLGEFGLAVALNIAFIFMFWHIWNVQHDDNKEREIKGSEAIEKLTDALNTNSQTLLKNSQVMESISEQVFEANQKMDEISKDIQEVQRDVQEIKIRQRDRAGE